MTKKTLLTSLICAFAFTSAQAASPETELKSAQDGSAAPRVLHTIVFQRPACDGVIPETCHVSFRFTGSTAEKLPESVRIQIFKASLAGATLKLAEPVHVGPHGLSIEGDVIGYGRTEKHPFIANGRIENIIDGTATITTTSYGQYIASTTVYFTDVNKKQ